MKPLFDDPRLVELAHGTQTVGERPFMLGKRALQGRAPEGVDRLDRACGPTSACAPRTSSAAA